MVNDGIGVGARFGLKSRLRELKIAEPSILGASLAWAMALLRAKSL